MDKVRPFRYTRGKLSMETSLALIGLGWLWVKAREEIPIQPKAILYHPIALGGVCLYAAAAAINPWGPIWLTATIIGLTLNWRLAYPNSYRRHAQWRINSFLAGFKYRHRPRRKLTANGLLNDQDPVPTISAVHKEGCITRVRVKMSHGDEINYWRERSARLAQTYNAGDCKVNPYRRETLNPFKHEQVTKYRWLELEFLTKDPFTSNMGVEYIDHYRGQTEHPVVAVARDGTPIEDDLAAHRLSVAMSRWGKSVRIRAKIYAHLDKIKNGELEIWGIDGKGGVEQEFLKHLFARTAYGDSKLNPNAYNPSEFDRLLKDAVKVLKRRQRGMRGLATEHIAAPEEPWLLIVIDELLVLTNQALPPELRTSIAASINLIQQQGIASGVTIDASTQLAQKDILDKIQRGGFTDIEVGRVEPGVLDMLYGKGWEDRGISASDIPKDLKGTFYNKSTDSANVTPAQRRYPHIPVADVSAKALGFDKAGKSKLWPPRKQHLQAVTAPQPPLQSEPEPEPEYDPLDDFGVS